MGFEVKIVYHPRKEEGSGYNYEIKQETSVKVGKPFDSTPLERLAGIIMSQMARRDIFVLADEIEVVELVRSNVSFKECKDGKGIILKNKKFSFNEAAQLVAEDMGIPDQSSCKFTPQEQQSFGMVNVPQNGHYPHEVLANHSSASIEDLYANPNKPVPLQKSQSKVPINQNKVLYKVYIDESSPYRKEVKRLPAKLSFDKDYAVHAIIPSPSGRLDAQKLAITDDVGKVVEIDEKYFTSVGAGLFADQDNRFSGKSARANRRPKLAFEDQMYIDSPDQSINEIPQGIPIDDGSIPDYMLSVPDIRSGQQRG